MGRTKGGGGTAAWQVDLSIAETFSPKLGWSRHVSRDATAPFAHTMPMRNTLPWLGSAQAKALMPGPQRMMCDTRKHAERKRAIQRCGVRKMIECLAIHTAVVNVMRRTPGFSAVALRADVLSPYHESLR